MSWTDGAPGSTGASGGRHRWLRFWPASALGVLVLVGDDVAEAVHIERARARHVGDAKLDVACADDVERRIEDGLAQHQAPIFGIS